ncbi:hypothetical protein G9C98_000931 [Cotesia typhae]|uniref:Uncharacterized protein n=1 Tax=Cotesia typhae TaxID=2053667 RepID=A0A8J5R5X3_9HYME|nr:hypothetical protein G9C98_000931 [Cotesia typhae]
MAHVCTSCLDSYSRHQRANEHIPGNPGCSALYYEIPQKLTRRIFSKILDSEFFLYDFCRRHSQLLWTLEKLAVALILFWIFINVEISPKGEWIPPDGGWGWLVLLAAVMVNVLIPGTIKSFGVLFVEFLNVFESGSAMAAWIPALCYFLYSSLGPLSSILSVRYSYLTVTLIGGTFAAVGMMLSFFADSIVFLCVSYGVFLGIGAGLAFPPTVYIVTSYFCGYEDSQMVFVYQEVLWDQYFYHQY